jgi:hypothetical protein
VFFLAGGPVFIGGRSGGLDMAAGFVCNLGWRFGGDYGLVREVIGVVRVSCCFQSFLVLGTGDVGSPRDVVVFFLSGEVDIGFFFLKWDEIKGELCLPRVGRALMVLCFP